MRLVLDSITLSKLIDYYRLLQQISSQSESLDLISWVVWNINIAVQAKLEAIQVYHKSTRLTRFIKNLDPSVYNSRELSMLFKLADGSFDGKLSTDKWAKMNKCSPAAASRDIQHLLQQGFLKPLAIPDQKQDISLILH